MGPLKYGVLILINSLLLINYFKMKILSVINLYILQMKIILYYFILILMKKITKNKKLKYGIGWKNIKHI